MSSGGIFVGMDKSITDGFNIVLHGLTDLYGGAIAPLLVSGMSIYIIWMGYQTLAGKIQTPIVEVIWNLARASIILAFVTNAEGAMDQTTAAINSLKDGFSGGDSVWAVLDTIWEKTQAIGATLMQLDRSTYVQMEGGIGQVIVWGGVGFMVMVAAIVNLAAEIILMLMTTTGPIFIGCLMFGWLRPMFNNWLQTIFSAILTVLFSSLSLQVAITYLDKVLDAAPQMAEEANIMTIAVQCCLAAIGAGCVVLLSYKIAGALAGASAQGSIQGMAAIGMRKAGRKTASAGAAAGKSMRNIAGSIGDKAASNLTGSRISEAAVKNMKGRS